MTQLNTNRKIGLFAPSCYGKSYLGAKLIKSLADSGQIVYIYDTDYEFVNSDLFNHANVRVHTTTQKLIQDLRHLNNYLSVLRRNNTNAFIYIVDLDVFYDKASSNSFDNSEIKILSSMGRHQRLGMIYEAKQTAFIPTKLISNTNLFYIGKFSTSQDMKKLNNVLAEAEFAQLNRQEHEFYEIDLLNNIKRIVKV